MFSNARSIIGLFPFIARVWGFPSVFLGPFSSIFQGDARPLRQKVLREKNLFPTSLSLGLRSGFTPRISIGPAGCRINRDYARRGWNRTYIQAFVRSSALLDPRGASGRAAPSIGHGHGRACVLLCFISTDAMCVALFLVLTGTEGFPRSPPPNCFRLLPSLQKSRHYYPRFRVVLNLLGLISGVR